MKKYFLFILTFFSTATLFAQQLPAELPPIPRKKIKKLRRMQRKMRKVTPPNGLWLQDSLFIDQTEIAVSHWWEYLHYLAQDSSYDFYASQLPDSTVFLKICHSAPIDVLECLNREFYFSSRGYAFFPIVGITHEQAKAYCRWRSAFVTENYNAGRPKNQQLIFEFRLPTEEEWEAAAQMLYDTPYGYRSPLIRPKVRDDASVLKKYWGLTESEEKIKSDIAKYEKKGWQLRFNAKVQTPYFLKPLGTHWIYYASPQRFRKLKVPYNLIGNVAEMTKQPGIAKGGSWIEDWGNCKIRKRQRYESANAWVGFRCVCRVRKR